MHTEGQFSKSEAERIAHYRANSKSPAEFQKSLRQLFNTYFKAISSPTSYASGRDQREGFVDSLLELASCLGAEDTRELLTGLGESPANLMEFLESLKVHPGDRTEPGSTTLALTGACSEQFLEELTLLAKQHGVQVALS